MSRSEISAITRLSRGLGDVDGRVGAVKVVLRRIHLFLLLAILVGLRRHSLQASLQHPVKITA